MTVRLVPSPGKIPMPSNCTILLALFQDPCKNSGNPELSKLPIQLLSEVGTPSALSNSSMAETMDAFSLVIDGSNFARCLSLDFVSRLDYCAPLNSRCLKAGDKVNGPLPRTVRLKSRCFWSTNCLYILMASTQEHFKFGL